MVSCSGVSSVGSRPSVSETPKGARTGSPAANIGPPKNWARATAPPTAVVVVPSSSPPSLETEPPSSPQAPSSRAPAAAPPATVRKRRRLSGPDDGGLIDSNLSSGAGHQQACPLAAPGVARKVSLVGKQVTVR